MQTQPYICIVLPTSTQQDWYCLGAPVQLPLLQKRQQISTNVAGVNIPSTPPKTTYLQLLSWYDTPAPHVREQRLHALHSLHLPTFTGEPYVW